MDDEEMEAFVFALMDQKGSRRISAPYTDHLQRRSQHDSITPALEPAHVVARDDAVAFVKAVRLIFLDRREKYDEFVKVLKDFSTLRIDTDGVILRVKQLFKGHSDLIRWFNVFLPRGSEIEITEEDNFIPERQDSMDRGPARSAQNLTYNDALAYLKLVRTIFQDRVDTYEEFLEVLSEFKSGRIDTNGVVTKVTELFKGHNDLIIGFNIFVPNGYKIKLSEEHP